MDILYLLDRLENLIASSRRMPLVNQIILKEAEILTIIDEMRATIPDEVKQARRINLEKERILAQAQVEASTIIAHAQEEAEQILSQEGLLQAAEERSREMLRRATEQAQITVRRAEEHSEQLKIEADGYVTETLRNLHEHLSSLEMEIGRTILSVEKGLESLQEQNNPPEELEAEEEVEPDVEQMPTRNITPNVPRRASLAADTMGAGPAYQ